MDVHPRPSYFLFIYFFLTLPFNVEIFEDFLPRKGLHSY